MKIKLGILGLLAIILVSGASAWDMSDPTTSSGSNVGGLIGKTVHISMFHGDYNTHIVTKLTDINFGMLQTSDWYYQASSSNLNPSGRWTHIPGTHWISVGVINMMWEEALPVESEEQEVPSQPGFGSILAILGLVGIAFVLNRQA